MSIELLVGERKEGETDRAVQACNDYLRMGVGRSLRGLLEHYIKQASNDALTENPPTLKFSTIGTWSDKHGWVERSSAYDATVDASKTAEINRLRTEGLAADYERIRELTKLFDLLRTELEEKGLWYTDTKISAKGSTVDVEVFNTGLLSQFRGVLDDVAKETGGRKQQIQHGGDKDNPFVIEARLVDYREGLAAFSNGIATSED